MKTPDAISGEVAMVTGASRGLGLLLGPVTVTTVVPGLMRIGSHVQAGPLQRAPGLTSRLLLDAASR